MQNSRLSAPFFARDSCEVASALLGKVLVSSIANKRVAGKIVETEAYCKVGENDLACHASKNGGRPTPRTAVMFGPPGYSYVYLNYGIHWLFNVVTQDQGIAGAVLVRALEPLEGEGVMAERRPNAGPLHLTNGPAKLTKALAIDKTQNKQNLCTSNSVVWIEDAPQIPISLQCTGPRVGLGKHTPEPWLSIPWRYWVCGNRYVSKMR